MKTLLEVNGLLREVKECSERSIDIVHVDLDEAIIASFGDGS